MEQTNYFKVAAIALAVALFFLNFQYQKEKSMNEELRSALSDANSNIDDANSEIEDAQNAAWSDYEDMGSVLENLETVDNVSEP